MTFGQETHEDDCEIPVAAASLPIQGELLWALDWIGLRASAVYHGTGVTRGHGEPVIVVPGFLGSYHGLHELTAWLRRIGYAVADPGFERNIECPDTLLGHLERRIAGVHEASGARVRLIGHSLGGSLARAAAVRMPEHVAQVITLGSPLREMRAHPLVVSLARMLEVVTPSRHRAHDGHEHGATCACELADALAMPFPPGVRRTAIFSRRDGVVDWRICVDGDPLIDVAVDSTHLGLVVNVRAYEAIAQALAGDDALPAAAGEAAG
ncbi:MAG TPA: hypothetical protein VFC53_10350 [Dehalococcoidia bacterium]|nr:hypothetical protein [Dehalococcoidia bacterium]